MSDQVANFAKTIVSGTYTAGATAITVLSPERFPVVPFNAVWWNATDYADPSDDPDREIVRVTSIVDDVLNVTRAQEGTTATAKNKVDKTYKIVAGLTAQMWNLLVGVSDGSVMRFDTSASGPEGVVTAPVGRFLVQTTTNKLYYKKTGSGNTGWQILE